MTNEFRLVATLCKIYDRRSHDVLELGIPEQLVEVLPRPPLDEGETEEEWATWYFCRVYFDDGIRFTEGLVAKQNTKPLETTIDKEALAERCMEASDATGVPAEHLIAIADFLSGFQNVATRASSETGPFLFLERSWLNLIAERPDLKLSPADRFDPLLQVIAASAEMANTIESFAAAGVRAPTPAEHAFVRLFGSESIDELITLMQPGAPDPLIDDIIASFGAGELKGSIAKEALASEINAAVPALLGPPGVHRKMSEVLGALAAALAAPLARAAAITAPLKPVQPTPSATPFPDNLKLDVNEQYRAAIMAAASRCDIDPAGLAGLIDAEAAKVKSGLWDQNSANPTSSARGLTQFLKGTWLQLAVRSWSTLNAEAKAKGFVDANNQVKDSLSLLKLRFDPALSIMSAAEYAASNLKIVTAKPGLNYRGFYDPKSPDGKIRLAYLCHHEGAGGAAAYLRGQKAQSYVDVLDNYIERKIVPSRFRGGASTSNPTGSLGGTAGAGSATGSSAAAGSVPTNVASVPSARPVAFAALDAPEAQWHWPIVTNVRSAMEVAYQTTSGGFIGRESRRFLANRQNHRRFHVGMDIFCVEGNVVLAIAKGTIVNYYPFYEGTNALFIAHDGVVVNYGEVMPGAEEKFNWNLSQKKNLNVQAGQPIALVGRLNMIHFEAYRPNTTKNARWMQDGGAAPANLLNPTKLLLGLAAKAIRVT
jgi:hypothetical protein